MYRRDLSRLYYASKKIFIMNTLNDLHKLSGTFSNTEKMPVLFLGHGSPMNAIEENQFVTGFRNLAKTLPQPNAILCISAHWCTNGTKVTAIKTCGKPPKS